MAYKQNMHPSLISPNAPFRNEFSVVDLDKVLGMLREKALYRMHQKGQTNLASDFETIGTLHEEFNEFTDAVHNKMPVDVKCAELLDIAFSAVLGVLFHKAVNSDGPCNH